MFKFLYNHYKKIIEFQFRYSKESKDNYITNPIYQSLINNKLEKNWKPFHVAIWNKSFKILNWMLSDEELKKTFCDYHHEIQFENTFLMDFEHLNCLSLSVYTKNYELTKYLIQYINKIENGNIEPFICDYNLLYIVCMNNDVVGFKKLCELYRDIKGDAFLKSRLKDINNDFNNNSIMHEIVKQSNESLMEEYLNECEKLNIKNQVINLINLDGDNSIHIACKFSTIGTSSKYKIVKMLEKNGIDLHKKNFEDKTCFHYTKDGTLIRKFLRGYFMSKEKIIKELEKDKSSLKKENLYLTKQNANLKRKIDRLYDILSLRNGKCVKRTESIE
jgi:hypothetical protein